MPQPKLFLLDAFALIYRAYFAMMRSPRVTSTGIDTSAIFGFCNTLEEVLQKEDPSHIAVCFDPPGPTFRHELYADYKAGRDEQPEGISVAIPYIKRIIRAYNIPVVEIPGYEADDVIGTLCRMAQKEGMHTFMMTPDKDYGQLVTPMVTMYRPSLGGKGFELRGPEQVCALYGIASPAQVVDLLALEGDKSDNIPGCPGVGEKTAAKLINEWGSVENMLSHADEIAGAVGRRVRENAEQIRFSKTLATIRTDVPLDITPEQLVRQPVDVDALLEVYRELEFRTFIKRLTDSQRRDAAPAPPREGEMGSLFDLPAEQPQQAPEAAVAAEAPEAAVTPEAPLREERLAERPHTFSRIATAAEAARLVERAMDKSAVGMELYAEGAEAMTATLRGMALALSPDEAAYIELPPTGTPRREMMAMLEPLFSSAVTVVSHNVKRSMLLLRREKVEWTTRWFDTSVAHYLLESESSHRLSAVAARYLGYLTLDYADNARKVRREARMTAEEAQDFFCEEAVTALRLMPVLQQKIDSQEQRTLLDDVEFPLIKVLADMEWTGVRIDSDELRRLSAIYTARLEEMEQKAFALAGHPFNTGSPSQVGEILFGEMKIDPKAKKTKTGAYSTTEEILEKFRHSVPLVDVILQIRGLRKLLATYIDALPLLVNPVTGKLHTTYNQIATATGRISSTNPNLQNIPIRTDQGREIRRTFIADPGCLILSADYSQIELRLIADISQDKDMVEAFLSGEDIHRSTAAKIYQVPLDEVTPDQRRNAKTANFGIIYGISAFGLSERLGIPRGEAKELIDGYFRTYPHIRQYIDAVIERARSQGYVSTIKGRKRYLPDITSRNAAVRAYAERNAVNAPLQGSAADIIKIAMVNIHREMQTRAMQSRMIMQVHDELIFNVVPSELPQLQELVTRLMRDAYSGRVPLEVSSGTAPNWLEAH